MPIMTWQIYKTFGIRATPPHIGESSQQNVFLASPLTLNEIEPTTLETILEELGVSPSFLAGVIWVDKETLERECHDKALTLRAIKGNNPTRLVENY